MSKESTFWWGPWAKAKTQQPSEPELGVSSKEAAEREAEVIRKRKRRGLPTTTQIGSLGVEEETPGGRQTLGT